MKKKSFGLLLAGAMTVGVLGGVQAFAANDTTGNSSVEDKTQTLERQGKHSWGHHGKQSQEQLVQEAQELGIATDGKDTRTLRKEVMEAKIKKEAQELGIAADGKELRDLAKEVHDTKVLNAAKELGISTENKSTKEIRKEIFENYPDKAKELFSRKGFPGGFGFDSHHKHRGPSR
ncbi:hypothetical protein [Effusibacillus lacus]|uniref:DUF2680 domain-containing protein n=1 Tax=Effusibacillus lacus TaxID=1348429 RepID=A0A292YRS8_9BACL|nr:hypothetical protein [Effusibacillus lacus]TCS74951.1 hypothetical protein EDD64_11075 [Effusibacillus lacus]GAX91621.1 hypothetical protein EFBL_3311 [Effusibacillus lacus]